MPHSSEIFDNDIRALLAQWQPKTLLDIGAGDGKYGKMARAILQETVITVGIEIDAEWIRTFNLNSIYDVIVHQNAMKLFDSPRSRFDLVIFGDVLEHMRKSDGVDLLNFLLYRTHRFICIYPVRMQQDDWKGHAHEAHVSVWDFDDFKNFPNMQFFHRSGIDMATFEGFHR